MGEVEVLNDVGREAAEVWKVGNRWLVYSPLIHRIRESGALIKLFHFLDKRPLTPVEVYLVCQLLLRRSLDEPPLPTAPHEFCSTVGDRLSDMPDVYDAYFWRMAPPLRL